MVNFHDPAKIARDFLAVLKLWHAVDGVYIWEFFTTLDYEWSVIQGRRPYRRTIWVYSVARIATLLAIIVNMIGFDVTSPINCQAWVTIEATFAYIGIAASSLLIVLRTIAIWNRKLIVVIIVMSAWWNNVSFFIQGIVRLRAAWQPLQGTCVVTNTDVSKPSIIATLASDLLLLLVMLIGLLRMRLERGTFGLARLLWTQGLIWVFLATIAQVLPTIFISLNLNDPYNLMFQTPALVVMSIAATRMYRSLTDSGSPEISQQIGLQNRRIVSDTERIPVVPFLPTTTEQYPASHPSHGHDSVYISTGGDKPHGVSLRLGDDGESNGGK